MQDYSVLVAERMERSRDGFSRLVEEDSERSDRRRVPVLDEMFDDRVVQK